MMVIHRSPFSSSDSAPSLLARPERSVAASLKLPPSIALLTDSSTCLIFGFLKRINIRLFWLALYFLTPHFFHCAPSRLKPALCSLRLSPISSNVFPNLPRHGFKLLFCYFLFKKLRTVNPLEIMVFTAFLLQLQYSEDLPVNGALHMWVCLN